LSNLVLFLSKKASEQLKIHKQLSIFPELYSQKYINENEKGLHFIIRIPNEMIFNCMSLFNNFFKEEVKEMFVINQMYSRRWMYQLRDMKLFSKNGSTIQKIFWVMEDKK